MSRAVRQRRGFLRPAVLAALAAVALAPARAENGGAERWWGGRRITGDLFGVRAAAGDRGLEFGGAWRGLYFGVLESQGGPGSFFAEEFVMSASLDFYGLSEAPALRGLTGFAEVRYREKGFTSNPRNYVDSSALFNPSRYAGGTGWRFVQFGLAYTAPELFGAKDSLTVHAGWLRPKSEFIDQPLAKLFANNAMAVAEGIGGDVPFTASFSSWGGTLEIKPVSWQYTKAGVFMTYPNATDSDNNGVMFAGYASEPARNDVWFMAETGIRPKLCGDLPGHYAFGGYYYGEESEVYGNSKYGFYLQADQTLFRAGRRGAADGQGLQAFSTFTFAPIYNNRYPFYAQGGLVYEGLLPRREKDKLMAAVAWAPYQQTPGASYTAFFEAGYRFRVSGWAWVQPFFQYIAQPDGTPGVANAAILGLFLGVDF